jgi:hypothetical protein
MDKGKKKKPGKEKGPSYDEGFKAAYDSAYFKGYEKGNDRSYAEKGIYAYGAYTIVSQLRALYQDFFSETVIDKATENATQNAGFWSWLANFIYNATPDMIKNLPTYVGTPIYTVLSKFCTATPDECTKTLLSANKIGQGTLAAAGIGLATYLYIKFQGTDKEKKILDKKIREARRSTEETSDRHIKRRRTNKLRQLSDVESASMSQSASESANESQSESDLSSIRKSRRRRRSMTKRKLSR